MSKRQKYSEIWNHFTQNGSHSGTCIHCERVIRINNGSMGNMSRHMRALHPGVLYPSKSHGRQKHFGTTLVKTKERSEDFSNELVRAVEKRPELYRGGHTSLERLAHWEEIANELGESVTYCKEEWRCLKKLFQSHVKEGKGPEDSNDEMNQQMELMTFLIPYVEQESDESDGEGAGEESGMHADQFDDQFDDPLDNKCDVFEKLSKPNPSRPSLTARKRKMEPVSDDSSKKLFLLSLMPDMRLMDNTQMRMFKRKVLELIDDILNDA